MKKVLFNAFFTFLFSVALYPVFDIYVKINNPAGLSFNVYVLSCLLYCGVTSTIDIWKLR